MKIFRLLNEHKQQVKPLFFNTKYMGLNTQKNYFVEENFNNIFFEYFTNAYLSDTNNYKAYALSENDVVNTIIGFYESVDDASWYWTHLKSFKSNNNIKILLDHVLNFNEQNGRLKFYSMFPLKYRKSYRRLAFSDYAKERYDYFDEFFVSEKHQPIFSLPWQILYNRTLLPTDTIVRCTFLKQKHRETLFDAGKL